MGQLTSSSTSQASGSVDDKHVQIPGTRSCGWGAGCTWLTVLHTWRWLLLLAETLLHDYHTFAFLAPCPPSCSESAHFSKRSWGPLDYWIRCYMSACSSQSRSWSSFIGPSTAGGRHGGSSPHYSRGERRRAEIGLFDTYYWVDPTLQFFPDMTLVASQLNLVYHPLPHTQIHGFRLPQSLPGLTQL